jgi:hypothetical protein
MTLGVISRYGVCQLEVYASYDRRTGFSGETVHPDGCILVRIQIIGP